MKSCSFYKKLSHRMLFICFDTILMCTLPLAHITCTDLPYISTSLRCILRPFECVFVKGLLFLYAFYHP